MFSQMCGRREEVADVVAECAVHVKIPAARFARRRHAHIPGPREMSENQRHRAADGGAQHGVRDVSHLHIDGVNDEHTDERCKRDTADNGS